MFIIELFNPSFENWLLVKERIVFLEQEAFGDKAFSELEIEIEFVNPNNIIILLKSSDSGEIIGNIYAKPIEEADKPRANEKGETAYVWNITVAKEYRGKHLGAMLMNELENELLKRNYQYMDLDAVTANNFAGNIAKVYKDRIIKSEPHDSKWGPQVYFRIKLKNSDNPQF